MIIDCAVTLNTRNTMVKCFPKIYFFKSSQGQADSVCEGFLVSQLKTAMGTKPATESS